MKNQLSIVLLVLLVQTGFTIRMKNNNGDVKEQNIPCKFISGRMGYVTELKATGSSSDDPVNIISKQSYVEMDRNKLKVYMNNDKVNVKKQLLLSQIVKVIYPISFNQPDNKINCIQIQHGQNNSTSQLEGDVNVKEPLTDSNVVTLCFKSEEQMRNWEKALYSFRNDCDKYDLIKDQEATTANITKIENAFERGIDSLIQMGNSIFSAIQRVEQKDRDVLTQIQNIQTIQKNNRFIKKLDDEQQQKDTQNESSTNTNSDSNKNTNSNDNSNKSDNQENKKQENSQENQTPKQEDNSQKNNGEQEKQKTDNKKQDENQDNKQKQDSQIGVGTEDEDEIDVSDIDNDDSLTLQEKQDQKKKRIDEYKSFMQKKRSGKIKMDRRIHKIVKNRQKRQEAEREAEEEKNRVEDSKADTKTDKKQEGDNNAPKEQKSESSNSESKSQNISEEQKTDGQGNENSSEDVQEVSELINKLQQSDDMKDKPELQQLSSMLKQLLNKK